VFFVLVRSCASTSSVSLGYEKCFTLFISSAHSLVYRTSSTSSIATLASKLLIPRGLASLRLFRSAMKNALRFSFPPLTVTETCLTAIVKSLISIACNGRFRPRHKLCLCVCIRKLQVSTVAKIKNTSHSVRVFILVRSPRLELGRVHHTPLKRTRLPIPP